MKSSHFLNQQYEFSNRHIGPNENEMQSMLKELGFGQLEDLERQAIPQQIKAKTPFKLGSGMTEQELLTTIKKMMSQNHVRRSYLGLGYHGTLTPTVIQRNVLENPVWYTAYTPYQAEIAQGRLEALLNFQTMVMDLTGMEIANSSLLDEGTAAAEAMSMAHSLSKNPNAKHFIVSPQMHPHVIEVLKTRSEPLGLEMLLVEPEDDHSNKDIFAIFVSYPDTRGAIRNPDQLQALQALAKSKHAFLIAGADLLSLTLLTPPGEWGADLVFGNTQRFGVPLGFGGPHAAYLAAKESHKRLLPGRLVGVSVDAQGQPALRLALQTREQHIRREKATSNICTAQVLLANMASFYAVYHGPKGLKKIAERIHHAAHTLWLHLQKTPLKLENPLFFDTLCLKGTEKIINEIFDRAQKAHINLRRLTAESFIIALDETVSVADLQDLATVCGVAFEPDLLNKNSLSWPAALQRKSPYLTHPVFNSHHSETQLLRYIHSLQNKDITLTHSMIPLGSCTMKLNATTELVPVSWPEINQLHPFAPLEQAQGMVTLIKDLEMKLADLTGFAAVSLQPNAGSQGEYAGLLVIRKYHQSRNEPHRNICLIPSSAHGTNPASAVMAGMKVVVTQCDEDGNVDIHDLKLKAEQYSKELAALMITYPSTHGVFEEGIKEICEIIHQHGGQVYMDGANMNALVGICKPAEFGADVSHMNLHKTFAIPHGGGGPGVGPIGVREHLAPFLPTHSMTPEAGPRGGVSAVSSAPWGSASILPISWSYITMMGFEGLRKATLISILNANYIAKKLEPHYSIVYKGKEGLVAHECIIDLRPIKKSCGVDVADVAKRLMDYGFHSPTMSWPVVGTLMIEPTESESKEELDRFIEAMIAIREEIREVEKNPQSYEKSVLFNAPHTAQVLTGNEWSHSYSRQQAGFPLKWVKQNKIFPAVGRVDNAHGDRHLVCSCPSIETYQ